MPLGNKSYLALRFDNNIINHWSKDLRTLPIGAKIERWERSITLSYSQLFYHDRAAYMSWIAYGLNGSMDGSWWWRNQFNFKLNTNWSFLAGSSLFGGRTNTYFGQYKRMDNIELGLKYSF